MVLRFSRADALPPARAELGHVDFPTTVPPEILAPPFHDELRHLDRGMCALEIDRYLRSLARQEASCRRVLGRLAAAFLKGEAHHRLGFGRLGDYTRERLGISARELQSVAHVVEGMDGLPGVAVAFEAGDISWTQARLLVGVATPDTEAAWIAVARDHTVRALQARIRREQRRADPDGTVPVRTPVENDDSGTIDGEPQVQITILCPRRLRAVWRLVVELARRMAGEPLPVWQAAEAIAAEGISSAPALRESAAAARPLAPPTVHSTESGDGDSAERGDDCVEGRPAVLAETRAAFFGDLDWSRVESAIPPAVAALARGAEDCDAFMLDARLRATLDAMHRIHWQTGRLLRFFFDLRFYQLMGFATAARYVHERLGISIRKAQGLIAVERVTWRAPHLMNAYAHGAISWLRALTIAPVLSATYERAWLARAGEVTVRRLTDEVDWALTVQDLRPLCEPLAPPPAGRLAIPADAQMGARPEREAIDAAIAFRGPASVIALFRDAVVAFTPPGEPVWRGLEKLLDHVRAEWEGQPRHHDPVFARDGWRCVVPVCSGRKNLHDHHLVFRSRGGDNARDNRTAVCAWHHLRGVHRGHVRAWGAAPAAIHWELGVRQDGPPLLRLVGDRYVGGASDG